MRDGERSDPTPQRAADRSSLAALAIVSVGVVAAALVATSSGLGVSPDGVAYLSLADQLRSEGSPYAVLAPSPTHYAPLWAILVGGLAAVGSIEDLLGVGRIMNAAIAGAIAPLVYLAVRRSAAAPAWWAVLAASLGALTFGLFRLSVRALTEPLFVALIVGTLLVAEVGRHRGSRPLLMVAAAAAGAATMTRFAGVTLLAPVAAAAWMVGGSWIRRVADVATVVAITVAPTAIWTLAAPATPASTHLGGSSRAGLDDVAHSIVEAGNALITPPTEGVLDVPYFLLGIVVIGASFVAAFAAVRHDSETVSPPTFRSSVRRLDALGLAPWLLFLVAYGVLIAVQRWWIDREVIARYWVPFVVVAVVVVARAVADAGLLASRHQRRAASAIALGIITVNVVLVGAFTVTRSGDGIELNERRFQDAPLFATIDDSGVDVVLTDSARLMELHLLVRGASDIEVTDIECRRSGESRVAELAQATPGSVVVVLADLCNRDAVVDEIRTTPGVTVTNVSTEPGVGRLVVLG